MQINNLSHVLNDIEIHKPSLPSSRGTPKPEKNKVVGDPTRTAINKQAAMLISPMRDWLSQPLPPEKLKTAEGHEIDRLAAALKIERNAHALTKDDVGVLRAQLKKSKRTIEQLADQIKLLEAEAQRKDATISQLEDIKL